MTGPWSHGFLQADLAKARRAAGEAVCEKLGIGSYGMGGEIDVATLKPSWTHANPTAYEVKVSRADFLADTQAGKYTKYLPYVARLFFAAPAGMLSPNEMPAGTGLIVRGPGGWHVLRASKVRPPAAAEYAVLLQGMLMKPLPAVWKQRLANRPDRIERAATTAEVLNVRAMGLALSKRLVYAMLEGEMALLDKAACSKALAAELGEEVRGRSLVDLARAVLQRAPVVVPPTQSLRWRLQDMARQAQAALAELDKLDGRGA